MDIVSNKSHKHIQSKGTHHEQSKRKINGQEKTVLVCLLIALMYHVKEMPYVALLTKRKKGLGYGYLSTRGKEGRIICMIISGENVFMTEESMMNNESDE